jgi:hypothetical protein
MTQIKKQKTYYLATEDTESTEIKATLKWLNNARNSNKLPLPLLSFIFMALKPLWQRLLKTLPAKFVFYF